MVRSETKEAAVARVRPAAESGTVPQENAMQGRAISDGIELREGAELGSREERSAEQPGALL